MDKSLFRWMLLLGVAVLLAWPVTAGAQAFAPSEDEDTEEADEDEGGLDSDYVPGASGSPTLKKPGVLDEASSLGFDDEDEDDDDDDDEEDDEDTDEDLLGDDGDEDEVEDLFGDSAEDLIEEATSEEELTVEEDQWEEKSTKFFDFSGYFRLRADLFHKFSMGFGATDAGLPFPRPIEQTNTIYSSGNACNADGKKPKWCKNHTLAGANIRLRFDPVIHLSENVRVMMSFDLLDNLVLGSIPEGGSVQLDSGGFGLTARNPWVPLEAFASTQEAPSWHNTLQNAIVVRAIWGEVLLKNIGMIKFGRMPSHFGMGLLANDGSGIDDNYGDIADRIMFATKLFNVILAIGWDFPASGVTSQKWSQASGQAYDVSQVDDVNQWLAVVAYKQEKEEELRLLSEGKPAFSAGLYALFRKQVLSTENWNVPGVTPESVDMVERDAWAVIADLWFKVLYKNFRLELEGVIIGGKIENIEQDDWVDDEYDILQWGFGLELEQTFLDDALYVMFKAGYASGDPNVEGMTPASGIALQNEGKGDHRISAFRFDPDYYIDLIMFREILGQIGGAYYLRPSIGYWIVKDRLVGQLDVIYSLASEPISTNGNSPHLGVEFDLSISYHTKDNFMAMLQYAYLIPLPGFQDLKGIPDAHRDLSHPQTLQAFLGITF